MKRLEYVTNRLQGTQRIWADKYMSECQAKYIYGFINSKQLMSKTLALLKGQTRNWRGKILAIPDIKILFEERQSKVGWFGCALMQAM